MPCCGCATDRQAGRQAGRLAVMEDGRAVALGQQTMTMMMMMTMMGVHHDDDDDKDDNDNDDDIFIFENLSNIQMG